jgi:hypothetical protein
VRRFVALNLARADALTIHHLEIFVEFSRRFDFRRLMSISIDEFWRGDCALTSSTLGFASGTHEAGAGA